MDGNITINIVEPGTPPSPTPIDPVTPNTGLFTSGTSGPEATIITAISAVLILTIVAIVITSLLYRKQKKSGKVTKLVHLVDSTKAVLKSKKRVTAGLSAIALLAGTGTLTTLLANAGKSNTNAIDGEATAEAETITPTVSGNELTVELGSEPVFAVLPVDITVEEATQAGYTLTAYTDNTDLVSTTDSSKVIPMVAVDEGELVALAENTYGLSLAKPETKDEEVYTTLSTDADNPTFITDKDYEHTEANDTTTIYYGFYITPDTPYGTYTSGDVYYDVEENPVPATVVYNGKGLYFNDDETQTTNTTKYAVVTIPDYARYSHTSNVSDSGKQNGDYPSRASTNQVITVPDTVKFHVKLTFGGESADYDWVSFWSGSHPDYTAANNYTTGIQNCGDGIVSNGKYGGGNHTSPDNTVECDVHTEDASITFAFKSDSGGSGDGYGYYAVVTGYDTNGNPTGEPTYVQRNQLVKGEYTIPSSTVSHNFLGWSEEEEATAPTYVKEEDIQKDLALTPGKTTNLYAVWQPTFSISYNGNGADATTNMDNVEQYTSNLDGTSQVDLLASNFRKDGYGFAGWSTDQDVASKINNTGDDKPTIYGPNQKITIDENLIAEAGENRKLVLNAVWVPAETNVTMQTFNPNSEPYASKPKGTVIALKDERDNQVYAVAKLADGNWWMIENLRLDNEPELSTTNTHKPSLPLTNDDEDRTTSNYLSATSNDWCSFTWSDPVQDALCANQSKLNTNNVANTVASPVFSQDFTSSSHNSNFNANIASYGNYYNWYSATGGNGKYETGSNVTVAGDVCPAGWHLPYGGDQNGTEEGQNKGNTSGGFYYLNYILNNGSTDAAASNRWRSFPNNFVYSGSWYGSSADGRGNFGSYWSSTAYDTGGAYNLYFYSGSVYPGTGNGSKDYGFSVRCVAPVEQ